MYIVGERKYSDVDATLAKIQTKLREGSALDIGQRGSNKVIKYKEYPNQYRGYNYKNCFLKIVSKLIQSIILSL